MPWTTLMGGEGIQYEYILNNISDSSIPVALPSKEYGFGWPIGGQPYLEATYSSPSHGPSRLDIERSTWPPAGLDDMGIEAWEEIPAGSRVIWNQSRLPSMDFGVYADQTLKSVRAHWLVGSNSWISSEPVPVRVVDAWADRVKVFDAEWSSYGLGKNHRSGSAYTIPIEGRTFLFWENWRVTEVGGDDRFEYNIDQAGTNLEILIRGASGERKVYVHLRHSLIRDTPWPVGPVKLFYPEPEQIPPAELLALRERANPLDGRSSVEEGGRSGGPEAETSIRDEGEGSTRQFLPWIGIVMLGALVAILGLVIVRSKKRGSRRH